MCQGMNPLPEGLENMLKVRSRTRVLCSCHRSWCFAPSETGLHQPCGHVIPESYRPNSEDPYNETRFYPLHHFPLDVFSEEEVYAGGLLKYLFREIHNNYHGGRKQTTLGMQRRTGHTAASQLHKFSNMGSVGSWCTLDNHQLLDST